MRFYCWLREDHTALEHSQAWSGMVKHSQEWGKTQRWEALINQVIFVGDGMVYRRYCIALNVTFNLELCFTLYTVPLGGLDMQAPRLNIGGRNRGRNPHYVSIASNILFGRIKYTTRGFLTNREVYKLSFSRF